MDHKLPLKAHKELKEILRKQFKGKYPEELIDDLGLTFLNLSVIALKRKNRKSRLSVV
ncbi:MAG TPA: hypothetical protein VJH06_03560 [Candidatus Paceibacterota bacterium]